MISIYTPGLTRQQSITFKGIPPSKTLWRPRNYSHKSEAKNRSELVYKRIPEPLKSHSPSVKSIMTNWAVLITKLKQPSCQPKLTYMRTLISYYYCINNYIYRYICFQSSSYVVWITKYKIKIPFMFQIQVPPSEPYILYCIILYSGSSKVSGLGGYLKKVGSGSPTGQNPVPSTQAARQLTKEGR